MIKKTYEQISMFVQIAQSWIARNPSANTKFSYALNKVLKSARERITEYQELVQAINVKHASEDERGNILPPAQNSKEEYVFTREALTKRNEERKKLFRSEVDIKTHIVNYAPKDLSLFEREALVGFVLEEAPEPPDEEPESES